MAPMGSVQVEPSLIIIPEDLSHGLLVSNPRIPLIRAHMSLGASYAFYTINQSTGARIDFQQLVQIIVRGTGRRAGGSVKQIPF